MGEFQQATKGVSNFITAPDFVPSFLLRNATEEQIIECMDACQENGKVFNVYVQTEEANEEWVKTVEGIVDTIIDADKVNPVDYFNK